MEIVVTLVVLVPILIAAWASRSGRGSVRHTVGAVLLLSIAAGATLAALALSYFAFQAGGLEGPGVLLIFFAVPILGLLAFIFWGLFLGVMAAERAPDDPVREARIEKAKAVMIPLAFVGAVLGLGAGAVLEARGPSHDAAVRYVGTSFDQSEFLSVDEAGVVKRWHAASGRLLGRFTKEGLKGARHPLVRSGPGGELLVSLDGYRDAHYTSYGDRHSTRVFQGSSSFFLSKDKLATTVSGGCLWLIPTAAVGKVERQLCFEGGVRSPVTDAQGRIRFLNGRSIVTLASGLPPEQGGVTPEQGRVTLDRYYDVLVSSPAGRTLLLIGDKKGGSGLLREGSSDLQDLPDGLPAAGAAFLDDDTLAVPTGSGVELVDVTTLQPRRISELRAGRLAASPRYGHLLAAVGSDLHLLVPGAGADQARSWKLRSLPF